MKKSISLILLINLIIVICTFAACQNYADVFGDSKSTYSETQNIADSKNTIINQEYNDVNAEVNDMDEHGGEGVVCIHSESYNDSYHNIAGCFTDYVGEAALSQWVDIAYELSAENATESCSYPYFTISYFIEYFNIEKSDFENIYCDTLYSNTHDYNVDVLYSENLETIHEYYTSSQSDNIERMQFRSELRTIKELLIYKAFSQPFGKPYGDKRDQNYHEWIMTLDTDDKIEWFDANVNDNSGYTLFDQSFWSIPQFIQTFIISQEILLQINEALVINDSKFTIDINRIYGDDPILAEAIASGVDIDIIDAMVVIPRVTDTLN
ncbi:hypothetical protein FACS1894219_11830 [Clostridia bacterium]|nr:hypothetical protein FACS1894219_11830 [Clostridia bacterium]